MWQLACSRMDNQKVNLGLVRTINGAFLLNCQMPLITHRTHGLEFRNSGFRHVHKNILFTKFQLEIKQGKEPQNCLSYWIRREILIRSLNTSISSFTWPILRAWTSSEKYIILNSLSSKLFSGFDGSHWNSIDSWCGTL